MARSVGCLSSVRNRHPRNGICDGVVHEQLDRAVDVPGGGSIIQVLLALVKHIKEVDDQAALACLQHRLADDLSTRHAEELLQVEELDEVLEAGDVKQVKSKTRGG